MGRVCWSDLIRTSRTMGRLIWFHVPPLVRQKTAEEIATGKAMRTTEERMKVMAEKRIALDLVAGYVIIIPCSRSQIIESAGSRSLQNIIYEVSVLIFSLLLTEFHLFQGEMGIYFE